MRLDRQWIARQIPHLGDMHLLNAVERWDENAITCTAISHRSETLPLRAHRRLGAACGIEYAAQTMAVHSTLICPKSGNHSSQLGYLISVRNVTLHVSRLDDIESELTITAEKLSDKNHLLYQFTVLDPCRILLDGRATILLNDQLSAMTHSPRPYAGNPEDKVNA